MASGLTYDILKIFGHFINDFLQLPIPCHPSFHPSNIPSHTRGVHLQDFRYRFEGPSHALAPREELSRRGLSARSASARAPLDGRHLHSARRTATHTRG